MRIEPAGDRRVPGAQVSSRATRDRGRTAARPPLPTIPHVSAAAILLLSLMSPSARCTAASAPSDQDTQTTGQPHQAGQPGDPLVALEHRLEEELERLRMMQGNLQKIEATPAIPAGGSKRTARSQSPLTRPHAAQVQSAPHAKAQTEDKPGPARPAYHPLKGNEERLADCLYRSGEYEQALKIYLALAKTTKQRECHVWCDFQIGNCHRMLGRRLEAATAFQQVVARDPESYWSDQAAWFISHLRWGSAFKGKGTPTPRARQAARPAARAVQARGAIRTPAEHRKDAKPVPAGSGPSRQTKTQKKEAAS